MPPVKIRSRSALSVVAGILLLMSASGCHYSQSVRSTDVSFSTVSSATSEQRLGPWIIAGPFPSPDRDPDYLRPDGVPLAFEHDFLKAVGGESRVRLAEGLSIPWQWYGAEGGIANVSVYTDGNVIDFNRHFSEMENQDHHLAYAYTTLESDIDQKALLLAGSDDGLRVWVNGELVHSNFIPRGYAARQDAFPVTLKRGTNHILVKVENGMGGWMLGVEALTGPLAKQEMYRLEYGERVLALQNAALVPVGTRGYIIAPGKFPDLRWNEEGAVKEAFPDLTFDVDWYDTNLEPADEARAGNRYLAVASGIMPDGSPFRRGITVFCAAPTFNLLGADAPSYVDPFPSPIDARVWADNSEAARFAVGELFLEGMTRTDLGAILLAALAENPDWSSSRTPRMIPDIIHLEKQLALKMKLDPSPISPRPLNAPKKIDTPAPTLRSGTLEEAGFRPGTKERLDAISREWAAESGVPFVTLVARNGVIVTHDAFGDDLLGNPVTTAMRTQIASISKSITGMMLARFLDQGYTTLDAPVGDFLPGFPLEGPSAITYRMCFTHMLGTTGHWEWGRMRNAYFENVLLNGLPAYEPGKVFRYNGMGYNLVGRAMERMSGKSIWRLMHEDLFHPLGIDEVPMEIMGSSARMTAYEIAVIGQVLANRGRYGDIELYSDEVHEQLIPKPLSTWYPDVDMEWGIGLTWMRDGIPGADPEAPLEERILFSPQMIGHGSGTSCVLRADPELNLVIAQARSQAGPRFGEFLQRYLRELKDSMIVD